MRIIAAGIFALFSISVSAEESRDQAALARQILSCVTYLSPKVKDKDSRYHVHSPKAQFYFNLDTSPRGVYSLSEAGAAFCPANFPRNGHIQFRIDQQEVRYSTSREGPESRLGRLQCQPISSEALAVMNRQAEDLIRNYVRTKSQVFVDEIQNELGPYCGQRRDFIKQAVADTRPPAKLPVPPPSPAVEPARSPTQLGN